jgi:hypothetical protein
MWLLGVEGARRWDSLEATPVNMDSAALTAAGFYLLTAARPAAQLVVHAGPQGTQSGGHSHADALSVCLQSQGRSVLLDPGTFEYVGEGGDRDLFRSTAMHNTLRVDGANQAETATPFSWKRLTQSRVEQWIRGKDFDLLVASHDGYTRLVSPVTHRRWVLSLKNGVYLVRDLVEGEGQHHLDISWHLGPDLELLRENVFRVKGASQGLAILPAQGQSWLEDVRKEDWSPVYGQKAPMTVLSFSNTATVPAEFAVLLVTLEEADRKPGSLVRIVGLERDSGVSAFRYLSEEAEYSFFFSESGKPWRQGMVSSDAGFVCWSEKPSQMLILCNGSYAAIGVRLALRCQREVSWGEVILEGSKRTVWSSDLDAVQKEPVA